MVLSKLMAAAANALHAVTTKPRSYSTPIPSIYGMTHSESSLGKSLVVMETYYGSGRWNVEVHNNKQSGRSYDGSVDGFNRAQTTAQIIVGLDKLFSEGKGMEQRHLSVYCMTMRKSLEAAMPQPSETLKPNEM